MSSYRTRNNFQTLNTMKILIIGSEGFIGSHAVDYFLKKNWTVSGIDLKEVPHCEYNYYKILPQTINYETVFTDVQPDVCLFASGSASVTFSLQDPLSDLEANFLQVSRVLNMIRLHNPLCIFVNISSAAVYGNPSSLPIKENSSINPLSPYGWHKYYSELVCKEFHEMYNIKTCSLRPFSVYGPGQNKLLFWDIYQKASKTKLIELYGTGEETRDYIYIDDLMKAIFLIIEKAEMKGESYNVASGRDVTIKEIANLFTKILNEGITISFNNKIKTGDPQKWKSDISMLEKWGFKTETKLEAGLTAYAKWLKENK